MKESFIYRAGSSAANDNKNIVKLREDIFQLKEKLDEEKTKTEVLKLIAENEKEKNDNFRAKFQTAKKLNGALINKLKERDISISKTLKNESNLLKKQVIEKDKKIDELKVEIKKLNNEIESFKREIQKNNNKEKEYIKENNALKENLNQKENIIKISNNKLSEINIKYNEEINKNKKLSLELKELNLKNQRLIDEKRKIPKSEKDLLLKMSTPTPIHYKTKKAKNNKSFDLKNEEDEKHGGSGGSNHGSIIEHKSTSKIFKLEKHYNDYDMIDENKIIKKYKKESNTIKEINEDNISISESSSEDNASPNEDKSEKKNEKNEKNKKNKENSNVQENSSSISEDSPNMYKEVEKIMNNNNPIQNEFEKNHEKTYSSFKDDKSTKLENDRNTNMLSYSETY